MLIQDLTEDSMREFVNIVQSFLDAKNPEAARRHFARFLQNLRESEDRAALERLRGIDRQQ